MVLVLEEEVMEDEDEGFSPNYVWAPMIPIQSSPEIEIKAHYPVCSLNYYQDNLKDPEEKKEWLIKHFRKEDYE
jgi:hypothetical protein